MKKQIIKLLIILTLVLTTGCKGSSYLDSRGDENPGISQTKDEENESLAESKDSPSYAQIGGAVVNPGVYELTEDMRLFALVELAGGLADNAAFDAVNLARTVSDGESIRIPTVEELESLGETEGKDFDPRININTAGADELMTLPGIGESKAKQIIEFREENGPFASVENLMDIPGIKEGVFNKVKDDIRVN